MYNAFPGATTFDSIGDQWYAEQLFAKFGNSGFEKEKTCDVSEMVVIKNHKDSDSDSANCVKPTLQYKRRDNSNDTMNIKGKVENEEKGQIKFKPQIRWLDLFLILYVHIGAAYGLYLLVMSRSIKNYLWVFIIIYTSGFGITAGVHRLWSHRAFKAKLPLRIILMLLFTVAGQRDIYTWSLDHRVHHKYSDTDSDPHNSKRGFFFSHVGWLVLTPHPEVVEKRIKVDMNDLKSDPVVMWQKKFYVPLFAALAIALPVSVPCYLWNESWWSSLWIHFNARFCITLHIAFFINSVAHMYGMRPYDKNIKPTENLPVSIAALGEGWHNYHHAFPYDYKAAEFGNYTLNLTVGFIDFFAKIGWAYDLKTVPPQLVKRKMKRSGDGSALWGWGDRDMPKEDMKSVVQIKP